MSLRVRLLQSLHHLLRVPPPAPVVQWRVPNMSWCFYQVIHPFPDYPDPEFIVHVRPTNTVQ